MLNEIRGNLVWLRLVKKNTIKIREGEENRSNWANLEDVESQTERDKRLNEYAGTDVISSNRAHSTNDATRPNDKDEDQARHASTNMAIRQGRVERGLVNHAQGIMPSLASTNTCRADYVTRRKVEQIREQNGHCRRYKYYMWVIKTSVFKITSRMQAVTLMLESAYILRMVNSIPTILSIEQRLSKYKDQL